MLKQRDLVMVHDRLPPDGKVEKHPFVIISCGKAIRHENSFIGVMMTGSEVYDDDFTFLVSNHMFEKPLMKSGCQLRLHIISNLMMHDLEPAHAVNRMKRADFQDLLDELFSVTFFLDP